MLQTKKDNSSKQLLLLFNC